MSSPFISWLGHGAASLAPPGVFTGAKGHVFVVSVSAAAAQKLVDTLLNPAGGGEVNYVAPLPVAMFSFLDIASCSSGTDVVGWLPGRETAIWIPLLEFRKGELIPRLVLWAPYIYINYTIGLLTGREVWGWPKIAARIDVPGDDPATTDFVCETTFFRTLATTTRGETAPLYRVAKTAAATAPAPVWRSAEEAAEGFISGVLGGIAGDVLRDFGLQPQIDCVVLKQFRTAATPDLACYQAIVNSPVRVTRFVGAGLSLDTFEVEITTCASHAIVHDLLGVAPGSPTTMLPVIFSAWAAVDFEAPAGVDIYVAP